MNRFEKNKTYFGDIISWLFILLFVYAAASKLENYQKFTVEIGKSPVLAPFYRWVAWLIPSVEIAISILLLFRRYQLIALYCSFTLMIVFSAYIAVILNFSSYVPCSCGGILENMNWSQHLWFNLIFVFLGALAVMLSPGQHKEVIGQ